MAAVSDNRSLRRERFLPTSGSAESADLEVLASADEVTSKIDSSQDGLYLDIVLRSTPRSL